jgi:hypothetical protein
MLQQTIKLCFELKNVNVKEVTLVYKKNITWTKKSKKERQKWEHPCFG